MSLQEPKFVKRWVFTQLRELQGALAMDSSSIRQDFSEHRGFYVFAMRDNEKGTEVICRKCPRFSYMEVHLTTADGATGATLSWTAGFSQRPCEREEGRGSQTEKTALILSRINRLMWVSYNCLSFLTLLLSSCWDLSQPKLLSFYFIFALKSFYFSSQVIFKGEKGKGQTGDIGLDDVILRRGRCSEEH